MSEVLPHISVTSNDSGDSSSEHSSNANDMYYDGDNGDGGVTDVEDIDSQASALPTSMVATGLMLPPDALPLDNDVTDVEDYNDSDTSDDEDEKSRIYPELRLSLQEFLRSGIQAEASINSDATERVEMRPGNFLQAQQLNDVIDSFTDCEDYNTDSEMEGALEKSVCVDFKANMEDDANNICIADGTRSDNGNATTDEQDDVSVLSDISDLASALCETMGGNEALLHGQSEDEMFELSGDEQVLQIQYSGSSSESDDVDGIGRGGAYATISGGHGHDVPSVDVTFVTTMGRMRKASVTSPSTSKAAAFLDVQPANVEEVLTDIERIDDSTAEDDGFDDEDDDSKEIPRAIILAPGDDGTCHTDIEDVDAEEIMGGVGGGGGGGMDGGESGVVSVSADIIPPAHREIVVLKENPNGDTTASVMPMDNEFNFGMSSAHRDEELTDSEDYSHIEQADRKLSVAGINIASTHFIESSDVTVSSDALKPIASKRSEMLSNAENVTDIEEIFMDGTMVRRKKLNKSRNCPRGKSRLLEIKSAANVYEGGGGGGGGGSGGGTDIEDMDLSESGLSAAILYRGELKLSSYLPDDLAGDRPVGTDIEDVTDDGGISDVSDNESPQIDPEAPSLTAYRANSSNIVHTAEQGAIKKRPDIAIMPKSIVISVTTRRGQINDADLTDSEDIQMPSEDEGAAADVLKLKRDGIQFHCGSREFNEMLNESYTIVQEKTTTGFNVETEKLHIKNMIDCREAHTDVEYVESDESAAAKGDN